MQGRCGGSSRGAAAASQSASIARVTVGRFRKIIWATPLLGAVVAALATGAIGVAPYGAPKCKVFPRNNPWNQRVDHAPVSRSSATYIAHLGRDASLYADVTVPYTTVPGSQRRVPTRFKNRHNSDRGPYPIPPDAQIEDGQDRHAIAVESHTCRLSDASDARRVKAGAPWEACPCAIWNLRVRRRRRALKRLEWRGARLAAPGEGQRPPVEGHQPTAQAEALVPGRRSVEVRRTRPDGDLVWRRSEVKRSLVVMAGVAAF